MSEADQGASAASERTNAAAIRDVLAGAALLAFGLIVGGSALGGRGDGVDYVFDALAAGWIGWGVVRLVLNARAR